MFRQVFYLCGVLFFGASINFGQVNDVSGKQLNASNVDLVEVQQLIEQNKTDAAIKILQTAARDDPQNAAINFWLGKAFYRQNNYASAIEKLVISINKLPENTVEYKDAIQMLGLAHYISGHLSEAIPFLEKLSKWSAENTEITFALGVSYIQTRNPAKSRETFARLFKVPANSADAYLLNAQMLIRQQFEETAETELQKALELNPKLPQANFLLGELSIYRADIPKGIELLQREIALNPAFGMAQYRLGEALTRQLKWDEAIAPLQKSIWLNPYFSGPYIVLGKVYLKKNDFSNAENMLRRAAEIDPKNFGAHHLLAQVLQQAGKPEQAKTEFALAEQLRAPEAKQP